MKDGCAECKGVSDSKVSAAVQVCHRGMEVSCIGDGASGVEGCIGSGEMKDGCAERKGVSDSNASVGV